MFCKTTVRITIRLQQKTVSFQSVDHMDQLLQALLRRPRTTSPTGVLWNMANSTGKKISVIVIFNVNNNNKYTWIQIIFTKYMVNYDSVALKKCAFPLFHYYMYPPLEKYVCITIHWNKTKQWFSPSWVEAGQVVLIATYRTSVARSCTANLFAEQCWQYLQNRELKPDLSSYIPIYRELSFIQIISKRDIKG